MQVNPQEVSGAKATTARVRPTMASHSLDLPNHCDICNKARSHGNHQRCSKIRQQRQSAFWAAYMDNVEAKRAQGGRRNAR